MNRREFARSVTAAIASAGGLRPCLALADSANTASESKSNKAPYDISVMLWTVFAHLPFEERLERVAAAGYRNVELVGEYAGWKDDDFDRANAKRKELGINFDCTAGLRHSLCNPSEREELLAELRSVLPIMERLECPAIILLSGDTVTGMTPEAQQQSCVDGLKAAARMVEGKKINGQPLRLLLENIDPEENPRYFLTSSARGFEIVKAIHHPQVQFLYDFFHEQISEGNLLEKLEKNIEHVGLVHIADVPGRHEPGTGEINYGNIFRKLAQLHYEKMAAMEFLPTGDPLEKLRDARAMALRAAETSSLK